MGSSPKQLPTDYRDWRSKSNWDWQGCANELKRTADSLLKARRFLFLDSKGLFGSRGDPPAVEYQVHGDPE